jgi:molybdate transport system regulatory protein
MINVKIKCKLWLEQNQEDIFCSGRMILLNKIKETGSIRQAANSLDMSYRSAWGKIKSTEKKLGIKLLDTHTGGHQSGATLTHEGEKLLSRYIQLEQDIAFQLETLFKKNFHDFFKPL